MSSSAGSIFILFTGGSAKFNFAIFPFHAKWGCSTHPFNLFTGFGIVTCVSNLFKLSIEPGKIFDIRIEQFIKDKCVIFNFFYS